MKIAKKKDKNAKTIFALVLAGAASVGLAIALKKKAPPEEFDVQIDEMTES